MRHRYFLLDLRAKDYATCGASLDAVLSFPFCPAEWAILDAKEGKMWNDFATWNGVPDWVAILVGK